MDVVHLLSAYDRDLNELQMLCTAIVVILSTITFIHIAGLRIVTIIGFRYYDRHNVMVRFLAGLLLVCPLFYL